MKEFKELENIIKPLIKKVDLNDYVSIGSVGAILETKDGNYYTGINIDISCSLGFCAEHGAVADMVKHGEHEVVAFLAMDDEGNVIPPCGRCRELISQLSKNNLEAIVKVSEKDIVKLKDLLPYDWKETQKHSW